MRTSRSIAYFAAATLLACGGSAPSPKAGDQPSAQATGESASPAQADLAPAKLTKSEDAESGRGTPKSESETPPASTSKTPSQILLQEEASFLLDFRSSDIGKHAEEQCTKQSGDDPAANAKCMNRAIGTQEREGLAFEKENDGALWLTKFVVQKGKQYVRSRVKCEIGEREGSSFKVTTHGASSVPKELVFELPDEFTLVYEDPKKGKLVYELRLGLIGETK